MHPHANFPLDILGYIADILGAEDDRPDTETLKVLSLTCKFMVPVCRRHLFSSLKLPFYLTSIRRSLGLRDLLRLHPAMTWYFKILSFNAAAPFCGSDYDILHLICASSFPTAVSIFGGNWDHLTERAKSLILSLVQNSTALHLTLKNISNFPAAALSRCTGLTELKLCDLDEFALCDENHATENSDTTAPISLHVSGRSNHALATLMKPRDLNTVGTAGSPVRFDRLKQAYFHIVILAEACQMYKLLKAAISLESLAIQGKSLGVMCYILHIG